MTYESRGKTSSPGDQRGSITPGSGFKLLTAVLIAPILAAKSGLHTAKIRHFFAHPDMT
jgi:hypothetical protein